MALIYEPEHADRFLEEMFSTFQEEENVEDLVRALAEAIQTLEDISYDYTISLFLEVANTAILDRIGALVGAQRLGLTDDQFRGIIRARIAALRSNGTIGDVGNVVVQLFEPLAMYYSTAYPAGFQIYFEHDRSLTDKELAHASRILQLARPAGVKATFVEGVGVDETFRFDIDPGFGRLLGRTI